MAYVGEDAQVLHGRSRQSADAERTADRDTHACFLGQLGIGHAGFPLQECAEQAVGPDVGASGSRVVVGPDDRSDPVVLETRGEDVGGGVAARVGDEYDGAEVGLADVVGAVLGCDGEGVGEGRADLDGLFHGRHPGAEVDVRVVLVLAADAQVERGVEELYRLGRDPPRRECLQRELGRVDVASAVVTDIHDQPVLGQRADEADEFGDETPGVRHVEGEDADVAEFTGGSADLARPEDRRHRRRDLPCGDGDLFPRRGGHFLLGDTRGEQHHLGPPSLVRVEVQALAQGRFSDGVRVDECRQAVGDLPVHP